VKLLKRSEQKVVRKICTTRDTCYEDVSSHYQEKHVIFLCALTAPDKERFAFYYIPACAPLKETNYTDRATAAYRRS
jgi:hypothetical protein